MTDTDHVEAAVLAAYDQYAPSVSEEMADRCALAFGEGFQAGHAEAESHCDCVPRHEYDDLREQLGEIVELREAYQEQVEHNRYAAEKHSEHIHILSAENERLRAVVDAARQLRAARIEMLTFGWDAHEQEAQATQALMMALIALDGS